MTKDDIIKLAIEADLLQKLAHGNFAELLDNLEHFASLVAAAEQKRCVGIIYGQCGSDNVAQRTVDAIRSQS
jgi:hypothetical protein